MTTRYHLLLASTLALVLASSLVGQATAVEGIDRVWVRAPEGATFLPYANAGYQARQVGDLFEIRVEAVPLESRAPFSLPARRGGAIEEVARAVSAGSDSRYEAVSRLLAWVARSIEYRLDREAPQDAGAVLERRSGYCTGQARLTVALLEAVGIEAREIPGFVFGEGTTGGFHRWVEVYYPDRGWVYSDPGRSHHYVPATYLPLAATELVPARLDGGSLVDRMDHILPVDLFPGPPEGVKVRRNRPRQIAGAVRVRVEGDPHGEAILEGQGRRWSAPLGPQGSTFLGLEPGLYSLRLLLANGSERAKSLRLEDRVLASVVLAGHPE